MRSPVLTALIIATALFHGEHGRDGHLDVSAGDRARSSSGPDRPQTGSDLLHADAGGFHSRLGLDRRPVRRAHRLLLGDRRLHAGLDLMRRLEFAWHAHRRARFPGARRRDDGARRAACAAPQRAEERSRQRACLPNGAGADRPRRRTAARWLHHHLFPLALDLLDQCADRHSWPGAVAQIHRQSARGGGAALRFQGICPLGPRACSASFPGSR